MTYVQSEDLISENKPIWDSFMKNSHIEDSDPLEIKLEEDPLEDFHATDLDNGGESTNNPIKESQLIEVLILGDQLSEDPSPPDIDDQNHAQFPRLVWSWNRCLDKH